MRRLQADGRQASDDERAVLAGWTGWGALPQVFDPQSAQHDTVMARGYQELHTLLSPEEFDAAKRSTLNAHYTDPRFVQSIWGAVQQLGFEQGAVLEPGCGSGNFLGAAPAGARCIGVELDPTTAAVADYLHPEAAIIAESFADTRLPERSMDVVVGNVPFGAVKLHDKRHNAGRKHSIHNHFLLKSLRLLRPGGVMAVITSRYTLDALNPAARRELGELGALLGAVRLPTGAHQHAAGTDVVTDILVFQRRLAEQQVAGSAFERSLRDSETGLTINEYFADHPEDILGAIRLGQGEGGRPEMVVEPFGDDAVPALNEALGRIVARATEEGVRYEPRADNEPPAEPNALVQSTRPIGYIAEDAEGFTVVEETGVEPLKVPRSQQKELRALLGLRDAVVALLEEEAATNDDTRKVLDLRATLGSRYDAYHREYGPINRFSLRRTGRVDPETGEDKFAKVRPRQGGFRSDPFSNVVYALEHFDEAAQVAHKADVFTERVIARPEPRLGADTPEDALAICLDTVGRVDLPVVARLLGVDEPEARERLGTLVFDEPGSERLVLASEYLSGNVRAKLAVAEQAAQEDDRFAANVAALVEVQPRDLKPSEIQANLGAPWIDAKYVEQFLQEILKDPTVVVEKGFGAMWEVHTERPNSMLATTTWGIEGYGADRIAKNVLEQRPIKIYRTTSDGSSVLMTADTIAASEKGSDMAEAFSTWVWRDPQRAAALARTYNDRFNATVARDYSQVRPSMVGLSLAFKPRDHQVTAVAQSLYEPAVGLFHEVGAGKTAAMIMGVMEKQRLGIVTKPVVVVPNHMLEQFSREWQQLYPQARLLAASKEDLAQDRRRSFVARCATNRWDAVIMTRSAFEKVPVSHATERDYLSGELSELREALAKMREDKSERLTLKRMERMLQNREERMHALLDTPKDPGVTFEQLGVDHVVVDEAHGYKNLALASSIPGMAIPGSQRASDLHQKLWYLRERVRARSVVTFATATPIANSISEAYTMTRFLRPDILADSGIRSFDEWAATFGRTVTALEVAPDGTSVRMQSRFAQFHNVPELMQQWAPFANIKTAEDLRLPVPELQQRAGDGKRAPEVVLVPSTPELEEFVQDIADRAEKVRARMVHPKIDNMLAITSEGRAGALDLRLLKTSEGEEPRRTDGRQKVDVAADRVADIYHRTKDARYPAPGGGMHPTPGALQLVFSDLGTPKADGGWSVYDELRKLLEERGVPRERVRFMHEAGSDREKGELFAACREGRVSVLLGSTEKMGVGTNVQLRAVALHHLDCPWRPADIAQREGRIIRQGNANPEVQILRYVTEGSFDAYLWQTVSRKSVFIGQLMKPSSDVRQLDGDVGEAALSYDEVKAIASGNPLLLQHAQATAELKRLERLEAGHFSDEGQREALISGAKKTIVEAKEILQQLDQMEAAVSPSFELRVGHVSYDQKQRPEAQHALFETIERAIRGNAGRGIWEAEIASYRGVPVHATCFGTAGVEVSLGGLHVTKTLVTFDEVKARHGDVLKRLDNRIGDFGKYRTQQEARIKRSQREVAQGEAALGQPFPKAAELKLARERWAQLEASLAEAAKTPEERTDEAKQRSESPAQRWDALVAKNFEAIAAQAKRLEQKLRMRQKNLAVKIEERRKARPARTAMFSTQKIRVEKATVWNAWAAEVHRLEQAARRVEKQLRVVPAYALPKVGDYDSRGSKLAAERAQRQAPELAQEVLAARGQEREVATREQVRTRAPSLRR